MSRTKKTIVSTILAVSTLFSASPIFASSSTPKIDLTPETGIITPFAVNYQYNNDCFVGNPGLEKEFNVQANYGWVKVWIKNTGNDTVTVTVTQGTTSGTQKMQFQVAPGQQDFRVASSPFSTGKHIVSVTPSQGNPVNVNLTVKTTTTLAEL